MAAQLFHIEGFETAFLHRIQREAQMGQLAIGKHVFIDERLAVRRLAAVPIRRRDALVHHDTIFGKEALHVCEVLGKGTK